MGPAEAIVFALVDSIPVSRDVRMSSNREPEPQSFIDRHRWYIHRMSLLFGNTTGDIGHSVVHEANYTLSYYGQPWLGQSFFAAACGKDGGTNSCFGDFAEIPSRIICGDARSLFNAAQLENNIKTGPDRYLLLCKYLSDPPRWAMDLS